MPFSSHRQFWLALFAHAAALLIGSRALACPNCLAGRVARASVFDQDFTTNLLLIASPLIVLVVIVVLLNRVGVSS